MAIYFCNGAAAPLVLLLLAGGAAMPSDRYPVDWNQVHRETLEHYTGVLLSMVNSLVCARIV